MIKTNPDIDYGSALRDLFKGLKEAQQTVIPGDGYSYARSYGRLAGAVKSCLVACTDMTLEEIQEQTKVTDTKDDIPQSLFSGQSK